MSLSEAKIRANNKYNQVHIDRIGISVHKKNRLKELVSLAAKKTNQSKNSYMLNAIYTQLAHDGISIASLKDPDKQVVKKEPKQPKAYACFLVTSEMLPWKEDELSTGEDYEGLFPTLEAARKHSKILLNKQAYPKGWICRIYGKEVDGINKASAFKAFKTMVRESLDEQKTYEDMIEALEFELVETIQGE